jgi:hypothetical protein
MSWLGKCGSGPSCWHRLDRAVVPATSAPRWGSSRAAGQGNQRGPSWRGSEPPQDRDPDPGRAQRGSQQPWRQGQTAHPVQEPAQVRDQDAGLRVARHGSRKKPPNGDNRDYRHDLECREANGQEPATSRHSIWPWRTQGPRPWRTRGPAARRTGVDARHPPRLAVVRHHVIGIRTQSTSKRAVNRLEERSDVRPVRGRCPTPVHGIDRQCQLGNGPLNQGAAGRDSSFSSRVGAVECLVMDRSVAARRTKAG